MKTIMNIEELLDVLGDTSIIVVRQQDHKILYANKKATQMNSELVENMICHGIWKEQCQDCPANNMNDKEYNKTVGYDEVTNSIVDICAMSILWKGTTKAFVVTLTPHISIKEEEESEIARRWLTPALSQIYEMTVVSNLNKNEYAVFHNSNIFHLNEKGKVTDLIDIIGQKLNVVQRENWNSVFSIEKLLNSFQQGNQKVLLELYFEKEQKWFSCGCFLVESTYSKEILGIMLIRDYRK